MKQIASFLTTWLHVSRLEELSIKTTCWHDFQHCMSAEYVTHVATHNVSWVTPIPGKTHQYTQTMNLITDADCEWARSIKNTCWDRCPNSVVVMKWLYVLALMLIGKYTNTIKGIMSVYTPGEINWQRPNKLSIYGLLIYKGYHSSTVSWISNTKLVERVMSISTPGEPT